MFRKSDFAWCANPISLVAEIDSTRPDTQLPLSYAGGQGQCFRSSLEHLGRSSRLNLLKKAEKVNQSPKGNMWSATPVSLLCMVVNRNQRKQGSGPEGDDVL